LIIKKIPINEDRRRKVSQVAFEVLERCIIMRQNFIVYRKRYWST